jgi:phosphoribosyl-ATP pyrophosphohydrolase
MTKPFEDLIAVLQERKANAGPESYTARLLAAGEDEIIKKIGEEAIEILLAAKGQGDSRLIEETADLIYHLSVLLVARGLTWADVDQELKSRADPDTLHRPPV